MKRVLTILITGSMLLFTACQKDAAATIEQFQKSEYPMNVGNQWRYLVSDALAQTKDTLTLKVVSKRTNGSQEEYHCELYQRGELVDTSYYIFSDNKIEYNSFNPAYSYFGSFIFNVPFKEGDAWSGFYLRDTIVANGWTDSFAIQGQEYAPVYTLRREVSLPNYFLIQMIFATPNVGVIYQSIDLHDGGVGQKQGFQLIDYDLQ